MNPRLVFPAGGFVFRDRKRRFGSMMFRALVISFVLHLSAMLSLERGDLLPLLAANGRHAEPISLQFRENVQSLPTNIGALTPAPPVSPAKRASDRAVPVKEEASSISVFPRFLPSTVRVEKSMPEQPVPAGDVRSEEMAAVSQEAISAYRLNISRAARLLKRYPAEARASGWEGTVVISIGLMPGMDPVVSIQQSSGYEALDGQALEMIEGAVRMAALPDGVRGGRLRISLPVSYRLAD